MADEAKRISYLEFAGNSDVHEVFGALLAEEEAKRYQIEAGTLIEDYDLARKWDLDRYDDAQPCVDFLDAFGSVVNPDKQKWVNDPMVDGYKVPGIFRVIKNFVQVSGEARYPVQVLKRGFRQSLLNDDDEIDWNESRRARDPDSFNFVDGEDYLDIVFPNCDPQKIQAMANQFTESTYTSVSIGGEAITDPTGGWHFIWAAPGISEDGTGFVYIRLGNPEYSLTAYRNYGTERQENVTYYWNVPKDLAQGVIDAAEATGASATASYGKRGLVDIVIAVKAGEKDNLSVSGIYLGCDRVGTYHFGWGYTKAELETFIDAHKSGNNEYTTRTVDARQRGDGLYDIIMVEIIHGHDDLDILFTITRAVGEGIVFYEKWWWSVRTDQLDTVKAEFDKQSTKGWTTNFEIRRDNGNCTYDCHGTIRKVAAVTSGTLTGGSIYNKIQSVSVKHDVAAPTESQPGTPGVTISHQVDVDDDGGRSMRKVTEEMANEQKAHSFGAPGQLVEETVNKAILPSSIANRDSSAYGTYYEQQAQPLGNGLWRNIWRKITERAISGSANGGASSATTATTAGKVAGTSFNSVAGGNVTVDGTTIRFPFVQLNPISGMINYVRQVITRHHKYKDGIKTGTLLFPNTVKVGIGALSTEEPAVTVAIARGNRRHYEVRIDEDGIRNYVLTETAPLAADEWMYASNDGVVSQKIERARNQLEPVHGQNGALITDLSVGQSLQWQMTDDQLYDWIKTTLTLDATAKVFVSSRESVRELHLCTKEHNAWTFKTVVGPGATIANRDKLYFHWLWWEMFRDRVYYTTRTYSLDPIAADVVEAGTSSVSTVQQGPGGIWIRETKVEDTGEDSGWKFRGGSLHDVVLFEYQIGGVDGEDLGQIINVDPGFDIPVDDP